MPPRFNPEKRELEPEDPNFMESRRERHMALAKFFKAADVDNIVEDQDRKKEFIEKLSPKDFKALLVRINGIFRDLPLSERGTDGITAVRVLDPITGEPRYNPPFQEDKDALLGDSLAALKRMGPSPDSAAMLGTSVNAIHAFADGNGRLSRFLYTIVASSKENFDMRDVCPEDIQYLAERYVDEELSGLPPREKYKRLYDLGPEDNTASPEEEELRKSFYNAYYYDAEVMTSALEVFCKERGTDFDEALLNEKREFSMKGFMKATKPAQLSRIMEIYRELKKEYVQTLIDVFENSSTYPVSKMLPKNLPNREEIVKNAEGILLKDLFYKGTGARRIYSEDNFSWDELVTLYKNIQ